MPNVPRASRIQPVVAVTATDAGGTDETVQKDVDGVLTTPPWDTNVNQDTQYEVVTGVDGQPYQVMTHNETVTVDGTRYVYDKKGTYLNGGTLPWNGGGGTDQDGDPLPAPTPQPANVTKVTSATDRQGNVTTYTYGTNFLTFQKSNGTTSENPLLGVSMPGGHVLTFTWGTNASADAYGRITSISDGSTLRTVVYGYNQGTPGHGLLTSVTTPGGKTTSYGYGTAWADSSAPWGANVATGLLTSMTDPRGLTTAVEYWMGPVLNPFSPYVYSSGARAYKVIQPNGCFTLYQGWGYGGAQWSEPGQGGMDDSDFNAFPASERIPFRPYVDDIWATDGWAAISIPTAPFFTWNSGTATSTTEISRSSSATRTAEHLQQRRHQHLRSRLAEPDRRGAHRTIFGRRDRLGAQ